MRYLILAATLLAAAPAAAQSGQEPQRFDMTPKPGKGQQQPLRSEQPMLLAEPVAMMIAAFDRDGDARVTRAEFDAGLRATWDSINPTHADTIGYITYGDWALKWLGDRDALPTAFEVDRDGDSRISYAELADRFALLFDRFDKNKDGVIDRSELLTYRPPMTGRGPGGGSGSERGGKRGGRGPGE
jgi:hypothetical protein